MNPVTTRIETDPLGELSVPAEALYGVQTLRAARSLPIIGLRPLEPFVIARVMEK
jgi:fumarate hydratase, class II